MKLSKSTSIYLADFFVFASSLASSCWLVTNFHILSWPKCIFFSASVVSSFAVVVPSFLYNIFYPSSMNQFESDWRDHSGKIHCSLLAGFMIAQNSFSLFENTWVKAFFGWGVYAIVWYALCNLYHTKEAKSGRFFHFFGENKESVFYGFKMLVIAPLLQGFAHEMYGEHDNYKFAFDIFSYLVGVCRHDTRYYR